MSVEIGSVSRSEYESLVEAHERLRVNNLRLLDVLDDLQGLAQSALKEIGPMSLVSDVALRSAMLVLFEVNAAAEREWERESP